MSLIVISDLHLAPNDDEAQKGFVRFLDVVRREAEEIIINGDLFSFWFGYRSVVPYVYLPALSKLVELADEGVTFKYLHGNHDFVLGPFFEQFLPASVFPDSAALEYEGAAIHVEHGDLVDREDYGYRLLRWVVRSRFVACLFRVFPPHVGLGIANTCAFVSRNYVVSKRAGFFYHCFEAAYEKMLAGADIVVYGHGHQTKYYEMNVDGRPRICVVVGGWADGELCFLRLSRENSGLFAFDPRTGAERPIHVFDVASLGGGKEA